MTRIITASPCRGAALFVFLIAIAAPAESLTTAIQSYFTEVKNDVSVVAQSAMVIKSRSAKQVNAYFAKTVKKHQPLTAIMKTNAKGIVINEYVRNEKSIKRKQNVAKQIWFSRAAKSRKENDCLAREENGRYYLYWTIPIFRTVSGSRLFDGALIAKVDLWDCFHKIAAASAEPFLIRLNTKTLYAHVWENKRIFVEDALSIPGIDKISVRYQKIGVIAIAATQKNQTPDQSPADSIVQTARETGAEKQIVTSTQPDAKPIKSTIPIIIGLILIILTVSVLLIIQVTRRRPAAAARRSRNFGDKDRF